MDDEELEETVEAEEPEYGVLIAEEGETEKRPCRWTSRKFLMCAAIVLGGIASVISGIATDNNTLLIIGAVCGTASACLYSIMEAVLDVKEGE